MDTPMMTMSEKVTIKMILLIIGKPRIIAMIAIFDMKFFNDRLMMETAVSFIRTMTRITMTHQGVSHDLHK